MKAWTITGVGGLYRTAAAPPWAPAAAWTLQQAAAELRLTSCPLLRFFEVLRFARSARGQAHCITGFWDSPAVWIRSDIDEHEGLMVARHEAMHAAGGDEDLARQYESPRARVVWREDAA